MSKTKVMQEAQRLGVSVEVEADNYPDRGRQDTCYVMHAPDGKQWEEGVYSLVCSSWADALERMGQGLTNDTDTIAS
tara:strand:+ start:174 stop:404 length:231 start_codon:yes stop_codon:yes gene_type:complete